MNNLAKVEWVLIYGECQSNVRLIAMTYAKRYPERYHLPYNYVLRLLQRLKEEGRFPGRQIIQQRRRANMFDDDTELQVLAYIRANPLGGKLIGPFFYDGMLNGRRYINFLTNELPRLLDDVSLDTRSRMFFQQDGGPAHNAIITVVYANPPVNLQDLKNKIQAACDILSEEQIKAATPTEFLRRLESCIEHNGEHFEQFIR
ncbi:Hypothetical protein CINCED_3A008076 [Cinara cedri]|uniref:DUF4817 domain-containing protein n=1 Tax=Cinara cedri TaxID=506608 RepID=A0A5E4MQA9_9HEMI|nr:Hypothetical protein CINCED_3A008076 [Cinara cedri]